MASAHEILERFYEAVVKRDLAAARKYLSDDLVFVGLFEKIFHVESAFDGRPFAAMFTPKK